MKDVVFKLYLVAARLYWSFDLIISYLLSYNKGWQPGLISAAWEDYGLTRFLVAAGWHGYY